MNISGLIPFKVVLDNGTEQILNLANVKRFTICPEADDEAHPRLAGDPPPGILIVLLFDYEFTVTLRKEDSERLLAVLVQIEEDLISGALQYNSLLSPPISKGGDQG